MKHAGFVGAAKSALLAAAVAAAAALAAPSCSSEPRAPARTPPAELAPPPGRAVVTVVSSRADVPLEGPRVEAEAGDFMLRSDGMVAVVSREKGHVLDFGPEGARDELVMIAPAVMDGLSMVKAPVVHASTIGDGAGVLKLEHRASALSVRHTTFFTFWGKVLVIESAVLPEDAYASGMAVSLGERVFWGNVPTWVESEGFMRTRGGTFPTRFIARDGPGLAYALGLDGVRLVARFGSVGVPGFHAQARGGELVVAGPPDRATRRRVLLAASASSIGDAAAQLASNASEARVAVPAGLPSGAEVEVAACRDADGRRRPYARFAASDREVRTPAGCFEARLVAPGHAPSEWGEPAALASAKLPPSGILSVRITENGAPIPARVQLRGEAGTPDPSWGEDPEDGAALSAVHTERGEVERPVPPGKYRVLVDRGFEYTLIDRVVEIRAGERTSIAAELRRWVDTAGWLAADLHLHAAPSPDAPQSLEERVRSLAASGVEVGVATDHNQVTDYGPSIERLGLGAHVASVVGDEVTTEDMGFGHFNVFPLEAGSAPLRWKATNPTAVFAEARARAPRFSDIVVQVNHPRMGDIGYFDVARFDPEGIPSFAARHSGWLAFDAIEVYNGDDVVDIEAVERCLADWFALLDAGYRVTATGNSDSHKLTFHEPGLPRTYVAMPSDDLARFDERLFVDAIRQGRAVVSGGPFVRLDVAGAGPGQAVAPGTAEVVVTADAPPWIDVASIELLQRGRVVARADEPFEVGPARAELRTTLALADGDWVVAVVRGKKAMKELYRRGVLPFSFTNPVRVRAP